MAEAGIEEALERARSGDPAALGELFRAFEPDLASMMPLEQWSFDSLEAEP